jgi:hypothetical protein
MALKGVVWEIHSPAAPFSHKFAATKLAID